MRIGVDLGGTKIEAIALSNSGETLIRKRVPTPSGNYHGTVQTIADMVLAIEKQLEQPGTVGIATPGAMTKPPSLQQAVLKNANSVCLNGRPLQSDLETALQRSIKLANDADCFALSEATDGAAVGATTMFGVIVGTGVGSGIIVRGQLLKGANAIAGEWGHNPLPWPQPEELPGPACYCGKQGCIETFLSGPGMANDHALSIDTKLTDQQPGVADIVAQAKAGNPAAEATLQRYEHRMARALASVINLLDPEVIVLGGGLSNIERLYEAVPQLWGEYIFSAGVDGEPVRTRLVPLMHGDSSGVRGAAWLGHEK